MQMYVRVENVQIYAFFVSYSHTNDCSVVLFCVFFSRVLMLNKVLGRSSQQSDSIEFQRILSESECWNSIRFYRNLVKIRVGSPSGGL